MKRFILPMAAIALMSTACDSKMEIGQQEIKIETEPSLMPVSLMINVPQTKATVANTKEDNIESLNVFVYRTDDEGVETYDSFYRFDETSSNLIYINPDCGATTYRFAVYANHDVRPAEAGSVLQDQALFSNESVDKFQMYGFMEVNAQKLINDRSVKIDLRRQCSKVSVKNIEVKWTNSANNLKPFSLKGIYLMDVPGVLQNKSSLSDNALSTQGAWYNTMGHTSKDSDALLYDKIENGEVTESSAYSTPHYLYGYISMLENCYTTDTWSPGGTRLVIEAEFNGQPCYYSILLSKLLSNGESTETYVRNKAFTFNNITITRPGAKEPYGELQAEEAINFSVSVEAWEQIVENSYTIK